MRFYKNDHLNDIYKIFGTKALLRSSALFELDDFLKNNKIKGNHCLEIGTYHGVSAVILSQYFKKVTCISIDERPDELLHWAIFRALKIDNVTVRNVKDNEKKYQLISDLDFDFCYMDGDHANDTRSDWKAVKQCGKVLFHEYWPIQRPVWDLVESLPQHEIIRAKYDCLALWTRS